MGAVNPSLITTLIFKKRPVQNVLQQLAFAINARASVNQIVPVYQSLAAGCGPMNQDPPDPGAFYATTDVPSSPPDYEFLLGGTRMINNKATRWSGGARLPSSLATGSVTVGATWTTDGASTLGVYRVFTVTRHRVGVSPSVIGAAGGVVTPSGTAGTPIIDTTFTVQAGIDVLPGDVLAVDYARMGADNGDQCPDTVVLLSVDLFYRVNYTLAS